jgi:hypothetical protein
MTKEIGATAARRPWKKRDDAGAEITGEMQCRLMLVQEEDEAAGKPSNQPSLGSC